MDGQYRRSPQFRARLAEPVNLQSSDKYSLPFSWDPGHLMNCAVNDDIFEGKADCTNASQFISRMMDRIKVFATEFGCGKGDAARAHLSEEHHQISFVISAFSQTR